MTKQRRRNTDGIFSSTPQRLRISHFRKSSPNENSSTTESVVGSRFDTGYGGGFEVISLICCYCTFVKGCYLVRKIGTRKGCGKIKEKKRRRKASSLPRLSCGLQSSLKAQSWRTPGGLRTNSIRNSFRTIVIYHFPSAPSPPPTFRQKIA